MFQHEIMCAHLKIEWCAEKCAYPTFLANNCNFWNSKVRNSVENPIYLANDGNFEIQKCGCGAACLKKFGCGKSARTKKRMRTKRLPWWNNFQRNWIPLKTFWGHFVGVMQSNLHQYWNSDQLLPVFTFSSKFILVFRAPPDCFQYFMGVSGRVQSFNFGSSNLQLQSQQYTACVRKEKGFCGIEWSPTQGLTTDSYDISSTATSSSVFSL